MVVHIVSLRIKPEGRESFLRVIENDAERSVSDEPGCIRFDVFEDVEQPNRFILLEAYCDEASLQAHRKTEHVAMWKKHGEPYVVEGSLVRTIVRPIEAT